MCKNIKQFVNKFIWCLPVFIMMLGALFYVNLFDELRERDIDRQLEVKHEFIKYAIKTENKNEVMNFITLFYKLPNTNTYLLDENLDRVAEKYYNQKPLKEVEAPYKDEHIRKLLLKNQKGVFEYNIKPNVYMHWGYRWIEIDGKKRLILIGVKNYPFDHLDAQLQISIGILLLLTSLLNWILVGYGKYLYQKEKEFRLLHKGK